MSINKLIIEEKQDNLEKKRLISVLGIPTSEILSAEETNKFIAKTNEVIDKINEVEVKVNEIAPITAFNFKENVATYAVLATIVNPQVNDGYGVIADGLVYIYNGTAFPPNGQGMNLGLKPNGKAELGDLLAVSGDEVAKKSLLKADISIKSGNIFIPANIVLDKYVGADGTISNLAGTSYGWVDINDTLSTYVTVFVPASGGNGRRFAFVNGSTVLSIDNRMQVETNALPITALSTRLIFTIDAPAKTQTVNRDLIKASYGIEISPDGEHVDKISGKEIAAARLLETENNIEFLEKNGNVLKQDEIYNLVNPTLVHPNSTYNNGVYSDSPIYHATSPIEVSYNVTYFASANGVALPIRTWREMDAAGVQVHSQTAGSYNSIKPSNSNTKTIVPIFYNSVPFDGLCISVKDEGFKPYKGQETSFVLKEPQVLSDPKSVVTKENLDYEFSKLDLNSVVRITLGNSDKIMWSGSSSIENFYTPDGKSFVIKLQDHVDIQIVPYGFSGQGSNSIAMKFQLDTPTQTAYGVKPSEINATYVFIGQTLNVDDLISQEYDTAFVEATENLIRSALARTGAKVILGTAYRTEFRPWVENSLKNLADKWGADFVPIGTYHRSMIRTAKYAGFYGSGHPAIRTHEAYTLPLLSYFKQFPRTKQGILLFEARNQAADVSELGYKDTEVRAEKFRSICVGEMVINADKQHLYDDLTAINPSTDISKNNVSEYMKLMKKQPVVFRNKLLIEFIIPKVRTEKVSIHLAALNVTNYYLFNSFTQSFESVTSLDITNRKYIEFDKIKLLCVGTNITVSDVYADIFGGVDKPQQAHDRIVPPKAGKTIIEEKGFDDVTVLDWNLGTNQMKNITTKFNSSTFNDMPAYLTEAKNMIELTGVLARTFSLSNEKTFGYRTLRIWTCARLNPKIYKPSAFTAWDKPAPIENPYTDVSWYSKDKYDYDNLNVIVRYKGVDYENQCKSINVQKVGLFWHPGYVDVIVPVTRNGDYELQLFRGSNHNSYMMEICDVKVEIL